MTYDGRMTIQNEGFTDLEQKAMALSRAIAFPLVVDDANGDFSKFFGQEADLSKNTTESSSDSSSPVTKTKVMR